MTLWIAILATVLGCKSSGEERTVDELVGRHAQKGSVAYAEGQVDDAIREYRRAIHRAWAIDDAYESGTNAYNLAACLFSVGRAAEARDWLLDSRVELCRAGASPGNVYLLEARIALNQSRLEDVYRLVDHAACSDAPCAGEGCECKQGPGDPCRDRCVTKIPCVGPKIKEAKATKDCENAFEAQVELTRARLAAEQYDIPTALRHLSRACELLQGICGHDLQADLHDVAALIHLAKGEYLQAGCHLDREAESLSCAGIYREIPATLALAAACYEQAGRADLAAKRLCRVARIWYGRGDTDRSWQHVQSASLLAETDGCEVTQVRLALLANEIAQKLSKDDDSSPENRRQSDPRNNSLEDDHPTAPIGSLTPSTPETITPTDSEDHLPAPIAEPLPDPQTNLTPLNGPSNSSPDTPESPDVRQVPSVTPSSPTIAARPVSVVLPSSSRTQARAFGSAKNADTTALDTHSSSSVRKQPAGTRRGATLQIDRNRWPSLNSGIR
ncbi:MAG: hypothetical protein ACR2NZ_16395 [Rubripirellula sp.]